MGAHFEINRGTLSTVLQIYQIAFPSHTSPLSWLKFVQRFACVISTVALCQASPVSNTDPTSSQTKMQTPHHTSADVLKTAHRPSVFSFIPYSAKYKITLDKQTYHDIGIADVNGTMEIHLYDLGTAWKMQQKYTLFIYFKGKDKADRCEFCVDSIEGKDGQQYSFSTQISSNGIMEEEIKGTLDNKSTEASRTLLFEKPSTKFLSLSKDVLFPLQHLKHILEHANKGKDHISFKKIFDGGTDLQEVVEIDAEVALKKNYQVNAFVSKALADDANNPTQHTDTQSDTDAKDADQQTLSLLSQKEKATALAKQVASSSIWQIKMNIFPASNRDSADPDYSYTQIVNNLGMLVGMKLKYIDPEFTINITLTDCSTHS